MEAKKHGVSLSALKSLQEFQLLLKQEKRKRLTMPFQTECLVLINDYDAQRLTVCADAGILSIVGLGEIFLKNRIKSMDETDIEVTFASKGRLKLFEKIVMRFDNPEEKTRFVTSLGNLFEQSSDESSSGSSTDSGI